MFMVDILFTWTTVFGVGPYDSAVIFWSWWKNQINGFLIIIVGDRVSDETFNSHAANSSAQNLVDEGKNYSSNSLLSVIIPLNQ